MHGAYVAGSEFNPRSAERVCKVDRLGRFRYCKARELDAERTAIGKFNEHDRFGKPEIEFVHIAPERITKECAEAFPQFGLHEEVYARPEPG